MKKRIICFILAAVFMLATVPAFADTEPKTYFGNCKKYFITDNSIDATGVNLTQVKVNLTSLYFVGSPAYSYGCGEVVTPSGTSCSPNYGLSFSNPNPHIFYVTSHANNGLFKLKIKHPYYELNHAKADSTMHCEGEFWGVY